MNSNNTISTLRIISQWIGTSVIISIPFLIIFFVLAQTWIITNDQPIKSDAIFVLAGDYTRPPYAADLYLQGFAPTVYVSRPNKEPIYAELRKLNIQLQKHEDIYKKILMAKGVPSHAIITFGEGILSTVEEAETLKKIYGDKLNSLLIVTSPSHTRRSKLIFEKVMPDIRITVVPTPYEHFPQQWWKNRSASLAVVSETAKTLFYLLGGAFRSSDT